VLNRFRNGHKPVLVELWKDEAGLAEEMSCSFCRQVVPAPLEWTCTQGHPVCSDCLATIPHCAWEPRGSKDARNMCRQEFVQTRLQLHDYVYSKSISRILEEMSCSLCQQLVPAPLQWTCLQGHPICSDCCVTVPYCHWAPRGSKDARKMCRNAFVVPSTRRQLHDYIYSKSTFECAFKGTGCEEQPEGKAWDQHYHACRFKPAQNF